MRSRYGIWLLALLAVAALPQHVDAQHPRSRREERERREAEWARIAAEVGEAHRVFNQAEAFFYEGNYESAMPLYQEVAYGYGAYTDEMRLVAQERLNTITGTLLTEGVVAGMSALSRATGFMVGLGYGQSFLEDDFLLGLTVAKARDDNLLFADLSMGSAPLQSFTNWTSPYGDPLDDELVQFALRVGATVPRLALQTGIGTVAPTVGIAWHHTGRRDMMPFTTGLAVFGDEMFMRLDVAFLNGPPRIGGAFGLDLR